MLLLGKSEFWAFWKAATQYQYSSWGRRAGEASTGSAPRSCCRAGTVSTRALAGSSFGLGSLQCCLTTARPSWSHPHRWLRRAPCAGTLAPGVAWVIRLAEPALWLVSAPYQSCSPPSAGAPAPLPGNLIRDRCEHKAPQSFFLFGAEDRTQPNPSPHSTSILCGWDTELPEVPPPRSESHSTVGISGAGVHPSGNMCKAARAVGPLGMTRGPRAKDFTTHWPGRVSPHHTLPLVGGLPVHFFELWAYKSGLICKTEISVPTGWYGTALLPKAVLTGWPSRATTEHWSRKFWLLVPFGLQRTWSNGPNALPQFRGKTHHEAGPLILE